MSSRGENLNSLSGKVWRDIKIVLEFLASCPPFSAPALPPPPHPYKLDKGLEAISSKLATLSDFPNFCMSKNVSPKRENISVTPPHGS
jgi:hypothetical protein